MFITLNEISTTQAPNALNLITHTLYAETVPRRTVIANMLEALSFLINFGKHCSLSPRNREAMAT